MAKTIKLTQIRPRILQENELNYPGKVDQYEYIVVDKITRISANLGFGYTLVVLGNDDAACVRETPEEVRAILEQALEEEAITNG